MSSKLITTTAKFGSSVMLEDKCPKNSLYKCLGMSQFGSDFNTGNFGENGLVIFKFNNDLKVDAKKPNRN